MDEYYFVSGGVLCAYYTWCVFCRSMFLVPGQGVCLPWRESGPWPGKGKGKERGAKSIIRFTHVPYTWAWVLYVAERILCMSTGCRHHLA